MKAVFILIIAFLLNSPQVVAQDKIHSFVEQKAGPKEGIAAFYKDFIDAFHIPNLPNNVDEISLRLRFVVEKDGSFTDIQVINDQLDLGKEAIRTLKLMPVWKPAVHKGKAVRSSFTLPIKIRVNNDTNDAFKQQILTQEELKSFVELLNTSLVETEYFDLKCNCALIKSSMDEENTTEEFMLETRDQRAYYNIFFTKTDEKGGADILETVKSDARNQKARIRDIYFAGQNAIELSFLIAEEGFVSHYRMIFFYKNGYFVGTNIVTNHPQIADVLVEHLKQAFILKI